MKGLGITGMILGILSILIVFFSCGCGAPIALLPALVGIILSGVSLGKYKSASDQSGRGMAIAGLVLCIIVLVFTLLVLFTGLGSCLGLGSMVQSMQ